MIKSVILCAVLFLGLFQACASPSDGTTNSASSIAASTPVGAVSTKDKTPAAPEQALACVKSINQFGQPGNCQCQEGQAYNPITGKCDKGGRICTMALVHMFSEKSGQCYTAKNGCEAADLKSVGWRERSVKDTCPEL